MKSIFFVIIKNHKYLSYNNKYSTCFEDALQFQNKQTAVEYLRKNKIKASIHEYYFFKIY
jgi:hypothetical protein